MIRPARATDQAFIAAGWARSLASLAPAASHVYKRHGDRTASTWTDLNSRIDALMDRPDSRGLVLCREGDEDRIRGWLVYTDVAGVPVVHYLYLRDAERRHGHATAMLEQIGVHRDRPVICTSEGPSSEAMRARYPAAMAMPVDEFLKLRRAR